MNIKEIKEHRDVLKEQIRALICEFNVNTGCCVDAVNIRYTEDIGYPPSTFLNLNLDVSI
jgi:hypothetical protein